MDTTRILGGVHPYQLIIKDRSRVDEQSLLCYAHEIMVIDGVHVPRFAETTN